MAPSPRDSGAWRHRVGETVEAKTTSMMSRLALESFSRQRRTWLHNYALVLSEDAERIQERRWQSPACGRRRTLLLRGCCIASRPSDAVRMFWSSSINTSAIIFLNICSSSTTRVIAESIT